MSRNQTTQKGNDDETTNRPLFETLASALPGVGANRENNTRMERDGRTPYGQVGSDRILRSTRTGPTEAELPTQGSHDIEMPRQSSSNPETGTSRKRAIAKKMVADKVIPNMKNATPGKRKTKPKNTAKGRSSQRISAPAEHDAPGWKNAEGLDPDDPEFFSKLKERQKEESNSDENE